MMKSEVTRRFRKLYELLPKRVQLEARYVYRLWRQNPYHPSLHFKQVGTLLGTPVYSVRIGRKWRALGSLEGNTVEWFWIGSHEAYNQIIKQL
jgi:hypothetical protein